MKTFTTISVPTSLGYQLSAWFIGEVSSTKLAILLPGFLDTKDYLHLRKLGEALAMKGYLVVSFDPIGIWQSVAPVELYSITNWLKEIEEVIAWTKGKYPTIEQVVLQGHSMGGMLSLLYAATHPQTSAVISIMGPTSFVRKETYQERMVKWKAEKVKISRRDDPFHPDKKIVIELPFAFVEDSLQYDLFPLVSKIYCPVLLLAGEKDVMVPAETVKELGRRFPTDQVQVDLLPQVEHDYRKKVEDIELVNMTILDFLNKNI